MVERNYYEGWPETDGNKLKSESEQFLYATGNYYAQRSTTTRCSCFRIVEKERVRVRKRARKKGRINNPGEGANDGER